MKPNTPCFPCLVFYLASRYNCKRIDYEILSIHSVKSKVFKSSNPTIKIEKGTIKHGPIETKLFGNIAQNASKQVQDYIYVS